MLPRPEEVPSDLDHDEEVQVAKTPYVMHIVTLRFAFILTLPQCEGRSWSHEGAGGEVSPSFAFDLGTF